MLAFFILSIPIRDWDCYYWLLLSKVKFSFAKGDKREEIFKFYEIIKGWLDDAK
jgi:hypothetical protein